MLPPTCRPPILDRLHLSAQAEASEPTPRAALAGTSIEFPYAASTASTGKFSPNSAPPANCTANSCMTGARPSIARSYGGNTGGLHERPAPPGSHDQARRPAGAVALAGVEDPTERCRRRFLIQAHGHRQSPEPAAEPLAPSKSN